MKASLSALLLAALVAAPARADDAAPGAVLDKAIKALGGEQKLAKAQQGMTWKVKGKITFNDNTNEFTGRTTVRGLDHYRSEFDGEFNGNAVKGVTVLRGDKGWRKFNDSFVAVEGDMLANEKRTVYLQVIPAVLLPLKGKEFKVESAGEHNVGGKPAVALKATGPDGKDFTIYFDKESGLPVKQEARVTGFGGEEYTQETSIGEYKDFDGVKKATRTDVSRDGQKFVEVEVTEFSVPEKVGDDTFAEPN
jgi:hypothetical protein